MGGLAGESNRYRIISKLCSGGMADIFLGIQLDQQILQRLIVIKRVHSTADSDNDTMGMFADEARIVSTLSHPNIVQIYDFAHAPDGFHFIMEYIDGENLGYLLSQLRKQQLVMPLSVTLRLMDQTLDALEYIHTAKSRTGEPLNIVHRDLDPRNLMMDSNGFLKIIDFGVAKAAVQAELTGPGLFKGKLSHVAPEIVSQSDIDHRADLYSIGLVLFEMVTGQRAYHFGKSPVLAKTIKRIEEEPIPDPTSINPNIPKALSNIIQYACRKDREQRFQTASEFQRALLEFAHNPLFGVGIATNSEVKQWFTENFQNRLKSRRDFEKKTLQKAAIALQERAAAQPPPVPSFSNFTLDSTGGSSRISGLHSETGMTFSSSVTHNSAHREYFNSGSAPPLYAFDVNGNSDEPSQSNRKGFLKTTTITAIAALALFIIIFLIFSDAAPWSDSNDDNATADTVQLKSGAITVKAPQPKATPKDTAAKEEAAPAKPTAAATTLAATTTGAASSTNEPAQNSADPGNYPQAQKWKWHKSFRAQKKQLASMAEKNPIEDSPTIASSPDDDASEENTLAVYKENDETAIASRQEDIEPDPSPLELEPVKPAPIPRPAPSPPPPAATPPAVVAKVEQAPVKLLSGNGNWSGAKVAKKGCGHCHASLDVSTKTPSQWEYFFSHNRHRKHGDLRKLFSSKELKRVQSYLITNCEKNNNRSSGIAGVR